MSYQIIGDYVLEYENIYDDYVKLIVWKTHRDATIPFSEVIEQMYLKPTSKEKFAKLIP